MKKTFISIITALCIAGCHSLDLQAQVVQTDPLLTAAVGSQTLTYKDIYKKRNKLQEQIIEAEMAVTLALDRVL